MIWDTKHVHYLGPCEKAEAVGGYRRMHPLEEVAEAECLCPTAIISVSTCR